MTLSLAEARDRSMDQRLQSLRDSALPWERTTAEKLIRASQQSYTHVLTLHRACRKTACTFKAVSELKSLGCVDVLDLEHLQMIRAKCSRSIVSNHLQHSRQFSEVAIDHSMRIAAPPVAHNTTSKAARKGALMFADQDENVAVSTAPVVDTFEDIEVWGSDKFEGKGENTASMSAKLHGNLKWGGRLDPSQCSNMSGEGARVYVIDTGCRSTHVQLRGRVTVMAAPGSSYTSGEDDHGHGTHVAATIAGRDFGIARNAHVTCIKALSNRNEGSSVDVISAINHVIGTQQARQGETAVLSISLGVRAGPQYKALDRAVTRATEAGIVAVIAAGNAGDDACRFTPARARGAVTVAATTRRGKLARFSNRGPCVTVGAAGVRVRSAVHLSDYAYAKSSGTSMAAPYVSGLAALLVARDSGAEAAEVRRRLIEDGRMAGRDGIVVASMSAVCSAERRRRRRRRQWV